MERLGLDAKLYRNTGTYAEPVWDEVDNAKDVSLALEAGEADVTTRASGGFRQIMAALIEAGIDFDMIWDTDDEDFEAISDAFFGRTPIEFAVMDGDIEVAGAEGLRATMAVTKFSRNEPLEEAMTVAVTIKPTRADNPPEWMVVAAS